MTQRTPEISIVVASHDRPLRLRWLLNALEHQTLPRACWEIVVAHDSAGPETEQLLRTHPLARAGVLRHVTLPPGSAPPGANRNAAWRVAQAPLIAFTDDDCRPPPEWLANALAAARRNPGAIVQGSTHKDPAESASLHATHFHSQLITPPTPWAQCANIVYPRQWLERVGGFNEDTYTGEDTDLALRCRAQGAGYVGAAEVLTYHAVVEMTLLGRLRGLWRWQDLPVLYRRHPQLRDDLPLWIFWKRTHVWLPPFLFGLARSFRNPLYLLLCIPWLAHGTPAHGTNPRGRYRNLLELPSRVAVDLVEFAAVTKGSIKHRSPLL